jgi:hypothetical protein
MPHIFAHEMFLSQKKNEKQKKVCFFLQLGRGTVLIDISLIPRAF